MEDLKAIIRKTINQYIEKRNKVLIDNGINENTYNNRLLLYEGLITSLNLDKMLPLLKRQGFDNAEYADKNFKGSTCIRVIANEENISKLEQICRITGWQIAIMKKNTNSDYTVILTRKFGDDADELVYQQYNGLLFHLTPAYKTKSILAKGITPRSKSKVEKHKDRVYLSLTNEYLSSLAKEMIQFNDWSKEDIRKGEFKFSIIVVMLNKLDKENDIYPKFFVDPMSPNSVYTHDNIIPKTFVSVEKLIVKTIDNNLPQNQRFNPNNLKVIQL